MKTKVIIAVLLSALLLTLPTPQLNNQVSAQYQKRKTHNVSAAAPEKVAQAETPKITAIPDENAEQPSSTPITQAKATLNDLGLSDAWYAVEYIAFKESSWNPAAINSIGACGLFQALPCSKLPCTLEDVACQVRWATNYATQRYGSWHYAYVFWKANGWW